MTSPSPIRCVLFDADGVLQRTPEGWLEDLTAMAPDDPDGFLQAVFEAESPASIGEIGFAESLGPVLERHHAVVDVDTVLEVWSRLDIDPQMMAAIAGLRRAGVICALATNQHDVRTNLMRAREEYADAFDAQFYSAELGVAKPSPTYFSRIVESLGVAPEQTLFIDDRADNVAGARRAGLQAEVFSEHAGRAELDRVLARHGLDPDAAEAPEAAAPARR